MRLSGTKTSSIHQYRGLGNQLWDLGGARPSLDLQFSSTKSLVDSVSGQQLVTFTRASSGTFVGSDGVLQTAANDVPRFDHNPTTGESLGLLVEEQRTNLLTYSEALDDASWVKSECIITTNAVAAPNGTTTADKIVDSSNNALHLSVKALTVTANTNYAYTVYVKKGEYSNVRIRYGKQLTPFTRIGIIYNFDTGVITNSDVGTPTSATVRSATQLKDGWVRLCVAGIFDTTSTDGQVEVTLVDNSGNATFAGTGSSGTFVWGAQLEAGSFPTSYIPTTAATATRSADVASITGTNFSSWYRQDEGTVFASCRQNTATPTVTSAIVAFELTTNDTHRIIQQASSGQPVASTVVAGTAQSGLGLGGTWSTGQSRSIVYAYATNNMAACADGGAVQVDTLGTMPAPTLASIGSLSNGSNNYSNGTIRRLTYWPQRLSNTTLQTLTQ